jgi:phosphoribosylglycinamide formyltransferase-1
MKISFLASHGGSSAIAIIRAIHEGKLAAEVGILVTNNRDAAIYEWCLDNNIQVHHVSSRTHGDDEAADTAIAKLMQASQTELIVCSGYMKKIGRTTLRLYPYKILNIHPALLPNYGGRGMYGDHVHRAVLAAGEKESGATVHYVTEGIDEGPIIKQQIVPVENGDTLESLRSRVQACESSLYLSAITGLLNDD